MMIELVSDAAYIGFLLACAGLGVTLLCELGVLMGVLMGVLRRRPDDDD